MIETRTYDDAGRVLTVEVDSTGAAQGWFFMPCSSSVTINEYDSEGRLKSSTRKAAPDCGCSEESQARRFSTQTYDYDADGNQRIESVDYLTDTPNDTITVDGAELHVGHFVETRTAGCASIEAQIGASTDAKCQVH